MTFDDDYLRVHFLTGYKNIICKSLGINWPPPEILNIGGFDFKRIRYSQITDEQRDGMEHICRGAEYKPLEAGIEVR